MATLAQINETLRDQTSSIEDGTRTTAGLRDRFGEFLDAAQKAGDSREEELEAKQKERNQRAIAQRPSSFTQGLKQGLGLPSGFGIGGIAQKILGAMGMAAGGIGLGAGKLLKFGPAIAVMSEFGEKAIGGLVDYVDKEIDGIDFSDEAKETLTKGGQFALAARFAGIKSPLGLAMAGLVGAYGEETMKKVNEAFGNEDGVYTIPGTAIDIDTESQAFIGALGYAMALIAPALIKFAGKRLALALALLPLGKGVKALSSALGLALGIKTISDGKLPPTDEIEKNKNKNKTKTVKTLQKSLAAQNAARMMLMEPKGAGLKPANLNAIISSTKTGDPRVDIKPNPNKAGKVPFRFPQLEGAFDKVKQSADGLAKSAGKMLVVPAILYEYLSGIGSEELKDTPDFLQGTTNLLAEATGGTLDFAGNLMGSILNAGIMSTNFAANKVGMDENLIGFRFKPSDYAGAIRRGVNSFFAGTLNTPALDSAGMSPRIDLFPPNSGLATADQFNAGGVGTLMVDESRTVNNMGGNMQVLSMPGQSDAFTLVKPTN
tara:strand:+ start:1102 stop:2739 length:1638 start_codon:yes stop_codon:yes gene_type:complete